MGHALVVIFAVSRNGNNGSADPVSDIILPINASECDRRRSSRSPMEVANRLLSWLLWMREVTDEALSSSASCFHFRGFEVVGRVQTPPAA
jgi:hypothetical protein